MIKSISKVALAAAAAALPGIAHAGTTNGTGTASFNVTATCSVSGATVNLGTYRQSQTWLNVGQSLSFYLSGFNGGMFGTGLYPGSLGFEYANFGSVTCDAGTPYTLLIKGTGPQNSARLTIQGTIADFWPAIRKLNGVVVADNGAPNYAGLGNQMAWSAMPGTGTGAPQALVGNMILQLASQGSGANVVLGNPIGTSGSYTDNLTYTLTF